MAGHCLACRRPLARGHFCSETCANRPINHCLGPACENLVKASAKFCSAACCDGYVALGNGQHDNFWRRRRESEEYADTEPTRLVRVYEAAQVAALLNKPDVLRREIQRIAECNAKIAALEEKAVPLQSRYERLWKQINELEPRRQPTSPDHEAAEAEALNCEKAALKCEEEINAIWAESGRLAVERGDPDQPILRRAWRDYRIRQRDERGVEIARYCSACQQKLAGLWNEKNNDSKKPKLPTTTPLPALCFPTSEEEKNDDTAERRRPLLFCAAKKCQNRRAELASLDLGRVCHACNCRFESKVRQVAAFVDEDPIRRDTDPFPWLVDVCSRPCWGALAVDEDEDQTPDFSGVVHAGTARAGTSTAFDHPYVAYLRQHGPATDLEASAALNISVNTIKGFRHDHRDRFIDDDGRPAKWRLA